MKLKWKKPIEIPDGTHSGEIVKIEYREEPYEYTDVIIKYEMSDFELKYNCPTNLSENSKLGRLLQALSVEFKEDAEVDIDKELVGKKITFMTITKTNKDKKRYSEIVADSIKPFIEIVKPDIQPKS